MKQLEEYWIEEIKNIKEFKEIAKAENPEVKKVWEAIEDLIDDQFIETATERGIARREKILEIIPFADDDIESRRFRVKARWNEQLPYTYRVLQNTLDQLCGNNGYSMVLNSKEYSLKIKIELTKKRMFDEVKELTRKMAPANMVITVELRYNQYKKLNNSTHNYLNRYSHEELRSEVII